MQIDHMVRNLSRRQAGLITRDQAVRLGMTPRMIAARLRNGAWIRVHPRVFRLAGSAQSMQQELTAALLWAGPGSVLSHRTAAAMFDLPGGDSQIVELTCPRKLRDSSASVQCHIAPLIYPADIEEVGGLRRTTAIKTLVDLSTFLPKPVLENALDDALRRKLTTLPQLRTRLNAEDMVGRRGIAYLKHLVETEDVTHSVLERMTLRLLRSSRLLPPPECQYELRRGRKRLLLDFAFPDAKLGIECDGFRFHSDIQAWDNDLDRRNHIVAQGWQVIHVTWRGIKTRPEEILARVEEAYLSFCEVPQSPHGNRRYRSLS